MLRILPSIAAWLLCATAVAAAPVPAGWKVLKDKGGDCQMAVPPEWTVNPQLPGFAVAPDQSNASIGSRPGKSVTPLTQVVQHALGVAQMVENTPQRVFWVGKPVSHKDEAPTVSYHVTVSVRGGACEARISTKPGAGDGAARRIAATVAGTR